MNNPFTALLNSLSLQLSEFSKIYVAYSGGLDSHVLLYLLHQLKMPITAIHINHGWSKNANLWQQHCQQVCQQLALDFKAIKVEAKYIPQHSLEDIARTARYSEFKNLLNSQDSCILTAHHQNDQAETLLLQLLRGSGVHGLAAMPMLSALNQGKIYRPLLNITREQLHEFAMHHGLKWIDDESNLDLRFDRNWIRHHILPQLQQRKPAVISNLARSANLCAQAKLSIEEVAQYELQQIIDQQYRININGLQSLTSILQAAVIRLWLKQQKFKMPSAVKLQRILDEVITARDDARPLVEWQGCQVRKFKHYLYAIPPLDLVKHTTISWNNFPQDFVLPANFGYLTACKVEQGGIGFDDTAHLTISWRIGGEKIKIENRSQHTHSLKKLFQEWQVPPWLRDKIPLLYIDDRLVSVIGYSQHHQQGWQIKWVKNFNELST